MAPEFLSHRHSQERAARRMRALRALPPPLHPLRREHENTSTALLSSLQHASSFRTACACPRDKESAAARSATRCSLPHAPQDPPTASGSSKRCPLALPAPGGGSGGRAVATAGAIADEPTPLAGAWCQWLGTDSARACCPHLPYAARQACHSIPGEVERHGCSAQQRMPGAGLCLPGRCLPLCRLPSPPPGAAP